MFSKKPQKNRTEAFLANILLISLSGIADVFLFKTEKFEKLTIFSLGFILVYLN